MMKKILMILALMGTLTAQAQRMDDVTEHSKYIKVVDEYVPAPGQYVNLMPTYEAGDTPATMAQKCTEMLANNEKGLVSLGGYGGFITFHLDHSIANVEGQADVMILGNLSGEGNSEPGIIMVSKDENGNGLPDDTWYELKGSADVDSVGKVVYGYSITYHRPVSETHTGETGGISKYITILNYILWTDNQGGSGYLYRIADSLNPIFRGDPYYPMWITDDQMTFGLQTLLPPNGYNTGDYNKEHWVRNSLAWGYVDNKQNGNTAACSFDFDNAVEVVSRTPVKVDFVDFIRVYTAVNQQCGWIAETSTEIMGAEDLHLDTSIQKIKDALAGVESIKKETTTDGEFYDLQGRKVKTPGKGLYIKNGKKYIIK